MKSHEIIRIALSKLGGPGSGHWGHAGRPGRRGGSAARSSAMSLKTGKDWQTRQAAAKGNKGSSFGSSPVRSASGLGRLKGLNDAVILEFDDGTKGIFKNEDMKYGSAESEVLAYELSSSLGWDLVPETVMFDNSGKRGSLQKWEDNTSVSYAHRGSISLRAADQQDYMAVLDGMLDNPDRHSGNWIIANDGSRIWAIDNGAAFHIPLGGKAAHSASDYYPEYEFPGAKAAWRDVLTWSTTPKAATFVGQVSSMLGDDYAKRFQDFLDYLPDAMSAQENKW